MLNEYEKYVVNEYSKLNYYVIGLEVAIGGFVLSGPTITYNLDTYLLKTFWCLLSFSIISGLVFIWSSIRRAEIKRNLLEISKSLKNYDFILKTKFHHIDPNNKQLFNAYINTLQSNEKRYLLELLNAINTLNDERKKEHDAYQKKQRYVTLGSDRLTTLCLWVFRASLFLVLSSLIFFGVVAI